MGGLCPKVIQLEREEANSSLADAQGALGIIAEKQTPAGGEPPSFSREQVPHGHTERSMESWSHLGSSFATKPSATF